MGFGDGEEDGGDLEDIVEVGFGAGAVFEEFVLVAGELEAFFAWNKGGVSFGDLAG